MITSYKHTLSSKHKLNSISLLFHLLQSLFTILIHGENVTSYNATVTITLQQPDRLSYSRISTFGGELWKDVIVHFACIRSVVNGQDKECHNDNHFKHYCCSLFQESLSQICQQDGNSSSFSSSYYSLGGGMFPSVLCRQLQDEKSVVFNKKQCAFTAATVPKVLFSNTVFVETGMEHTLTGGEAKLDPMVYLMVRAQIPTEEASDGLDTTNIGWTGRVPVPLMQWNNYENPKTWIRYDHAYSPFYVQVQRNDDYQSDCIINHRRSQNITSNNYLNGCMTVSLQSNLSPEERGMHRSFTHTISLDISKQLLLQDGSHKVQIQMFHPLSRDVYVDVDEPFPFGNSCWTSISTVRNTQQDRYIKEHLFDCKVHLITVPDSIIDIEQPTFSSPQHVVAFVIDVVLDAMDDGDVYEKKVRWKGDSFHLAVTFVTQLHFRYAETIHRSNVGKLGSLSMVHIPTPFVHGAKLSHWKEIENGTLSETVIYNHVKRIDATRHHVEFVSSGSWERALGEITTGVDDHHDIVIFITLLASLAGAWRILNDMSKVSIWK